MALVPKTIEEQIGQLIESTGSLELEQAKIAFKQQLAAIIVSAIQSATVTIPPGAIVTVGSAVTQTNALPATGNLT